MSGNGWRRDEVAVVCSPVSGKRVSALKWRWRRDTHGCSRPAVHNELDIIYCMLDQYLRGLFVTPSEMALASRSQHMRKENTDNWEPCSLWLFLWSRSEAKITDVCVTNSTRLRPTFVANQVIYHVPVAARRSVCYLCLRYRYPVVLGGSP